LAIYQIWYKKLLKYIKDEKQVRSIAVNEGFKCAKCGGTGFTQDQMRATGGFWAKIFDVQNKKFTTLSCDNCGYTELYKGTSSMMGNIFDLFTN